MSAPTLPAMTDEQIEQCSSYSHNRYAFARAIIAARDAQWAARLDAAVRAEREMCAHYCERVAVAFESQGKPRDGDLYGRAIREAARTIRARTKA